MNALYLIMIILGLFFLLLLFFVESGSSNQLSANFSGDNNDNTGFCGGQNACLTLSEVILTIIVVLLLVFGAVGMVKSGEKEKLQQAIPVIQQRATQQASQGSYITPQNIKVAANNASNINKSYNSLKNLKSISDLSKYASSAEGAEGAASLFSTAETLAPLLAL